MFQPIKKIVKNIIPFMFLAVTLHAEAKDMTTDTQIAQTYFYALYGSDFKTVRKLLSDDVVFEDPTSPDETSVPKLLKGKEAYLEFWEGKADQLEKSINIIDSYESANYVILTVEGTGTGPAELFNVEGKKIELDAKGIVVLEVIDGVVTRHLDFFDYNKTYSSIRVIE